MRGSAVDQVEIWLTLGRVQSSDLIELTIGYHKLTGKVVPLKKPLVLMEKHTAAEDGDDGSPQPLEYKVGSRQHVHRLLRCKCHTRSAAVQAVGVVRQKLLFKTRPRAMIGGSMAP